MPAISIEKRTGRETYVELFDSFSELVSHVRQEPEENDPARCSSMKKAETSFHGENGCKTYAEALQLADTGWIEGLEQVRDVSDQIARLACHAMAEQYPMDIAGDILDVGAFCSGDPDHWMTFEEDPRMRTGTRIVRIKVACSANCDVQGEEITIRGAAVCALIDALETQGVRCELVAQVNSAGAYTGGNPKKGHWLEMIVKRASEHLNREACAFIFANPSFFRRLIFRATELLPKKWRGHMGAYSGSGYGHTIDPYANGTTEKDCDVWIPPAEPHHRLCKNQDSALEWVKETVNKLTKGE